MTGLRYGVCRRCGALALMTYRGWRHASGVPCRRTWRHPFRAGGFLDLPTP